MGAWTLLWMKWGSLSGELIFKTFLISFQKKSSFFVLFYYYFLVDFFNLDFLILFFYL